MVKIEPFANTPIDKIDGVYNRVHKSFLSHKTRDIEFRLTQLRKLYWGYDNTAKLQPMHRTGELMHLAA